MNHTTSTVPLWECSSSHASCVPHSKQGANYKEGLTPVLSLLTEGSRYHREIRRYIKTQVLEWEWPQANVLSVYFVICPDPDTQSDAKLRSLKPLEWDLKCILMTDLGDISY